VRLNEAAAPEHSDNKRAREVALLASAITLTSPGIPMILQGSEFLQEGSFNDWQALEWDKMERHQGIVLAHRHMIDLRLNRFGHTAGLMGANTAIIHQDNVNYVLAYHRWDNGGAGDDVVVVANFTGAQFNDYSLHLPRNGAWQVRFNSSWQGYAQDFKEIPIDTAITDENGTATISLPAYGILILSQD
jgi:1,4-alpha-glucan branching enzyme